MINRWSIVFPERLLSRIKQGHNHIQVDVHGLSKRSTLKFLKNLIILTKGNFKLTVIHGYRNGQGIKTMLKTTYLHPRVQATYNDKKNPGITILKISEEIL